MRKHILASAVALALCSVLCCGLISPVCADNTAPIAENFEFETYRGVSFGGQLAAIDPDGDTLNYEITTQPVKGTIELDDDGSFIYTPAEGKRGKDYFGYKAIDAEGNSSQEATVIIKLVKCDSEVSYIDMVGNPSCRSAMKLAECGAFVGKCLGGEYYFEPEQSLTRGEFLSLCLEVTGTDLLSGVVSTGFSDDDDIPSWLKSYVSTAVMQGIVKGHLTDKGTCFEADSEISRAEAMVILNRALRLSDVSYLKVSDAVPTWAAQSAANLTACGIVGDDEVTVESLNRAEAADMLAAAMDLIENR